MYVYTYTHVRICICIYVCIHTYVAYAYMAEGEVSPSAEEVKTLFISGLPNDIKEREIYNLFRSHQGYESSQLKYSGRGHQVNIYNTPSSASQPYISDFEFFI